jgi:hypothetical protein
MRRPRSALLLLLVSMAGCGGGSTATSSTPLGRSLGAGDEPISRAPAPTGDPAGERNGTVAPGQATAENRPAPRSLAPSPRAALLRYALIYINWRASSLPARERELASLAIGEARLAAQQIAGSRSGAAELAADHVQNNGVVLAITPGQGPAHGRWVVVTEEKTVGAGPYAGLPWSPHVTLAWTAHLGTGWAVSEWTPRS